MVALCLPSSSHLIQGPVSEEWGLFRFSCFGGSFDPHGRGNPGIRCIGHFLPFVLFRVIDQMVALPVVIAGLVPSNRKLTHNTIFTCPPTAPQNTPLSTHLNRQLHHVAYAQGDPRSGRRNISRLFSYNYAKISTLLRDKTRFYNTLYIVGGVEHDMVNLARYAPPKQRVIIQLMASASLLSI